MLGSLLRELTDPVTAEFALEAIGNADVRQRVQEAAQAQGVSPGAAVVGAVRHLLDHGGEDIWLDLLGRMSGSPQPGMVAVHAILAHAFPDPVRVRITRSSRSQ